MTSLQFRFESSPTGGWVGLLEGSAMVSGPLATQNAGSINHADANGDPLYYQVAGAGVNGRFAAALTASGQRGVVNQALRTAYDARYGSGAWTADAAPAQPRADRLTSFAVPLTPDGSHIAHQVAAMVYSVGPILGPAGITDEAAYRGLYSDAVAALAAYNSSATTPISALRITMLSCGIYASTVNDPAALFLTAARNIIGGLAQGVNAHPMGLTVLINTNDAIASPTERPNFTAAATALGLAVDHSGFSADPAAVSAQL